MAVDYKWPIIMGRENKLRRSKPFV